MCCTGKNRVRKLTPRQKFQPNQPVVDKVAESKPKIIKSTKTVFVKPKKVKLSEVASHTTRRRKRTKKE